MPDQEVRDILEKISIFDKLYDQMRLVDPFSGRVVEYDNGILNQLNTRCFEYWTRNKACENCISMRALNENNTFIKIEYTKDNIYMITAIPYELSDRKIVIELLKDVTDSMTFERTKADGTENNEMHSLIDHMNNIAMKDSLTGIYNRRFIDEKLPVDLINAVISESHLSIILADIDYFKKVNDKYGHLVGDCVLKSLAELFRRSLKRENDWVARYGGEEFLICLPSADLEKAAEIAETMRKNTEAYLFDCGGNQFNLTVSFGIFSGKPKQTDTVETLIRKADVNLYAAKKNGRNRVEFQQE